MFQTIKSQVSLLEVLQKDTGLEFVESGENLVPDPDTCPICSHNNCFRVKVHPEILEEDFYKCFSCGSYGDVISWRSAFKKVSTLDAARDLATEYNIVLPKDWSPVQQIFSAAAKYYEVCFNETCNIPYRELQGKTPLQYQTDVRKHQIGTINEMHIGWSDGGLIEYLSSIGFDEETIEESGLRNKKTGKDFLPSRCFIYPHFVKGRVSHFTFKDVSKRLAYQLPKKYTLNQYVFYNQDSIKNSGMVVLVEGENDLISCLNQNSNLAVLASIGQISSEQLEWLKDNLEGRNVLTIFDPDSAGDKYRVKVEKLRKFFRNLAHVLPPDGKDIDEHISNGAKLDELISNNLIKVDPEKPIAVETTEEVIEEETLSVDWDKSVPESFKNSLKENGLGLPGIKEAPLVNLSEDETVEDLNKEVVSDDGGVVQKGRAYYRVKFKDGEEILTRISNFYMKMINMFITESGGRRREVVMIRMDGYRSEPFMVEDETKVKVPNFRVLAARVADASFNGTEKELSGIWEIVNSKSCSVEVKIPIIVGRHEKYKAWIFRNKIITDDGEVVDPDENGIFWLHGRSIGIRPDSLSIEDGGGVSDRSDIPELLSDMTLEERDTVLSGVIHNVGKNLNSPGKALTMVGWTYASVYSNLLFELNRGFPFLFFWGVNGQGKSTVAKWITQDFFGINGHGSTSVPNLRTGVGWARKAEYYASMPLFIDEVRSDENTKQYLGVFRSYYDREARTMGTKEAFGVRIVRPRAVFVFNGEDQFEDPATRERCIPIRIPIKDRELQDSYKWMEANKHLFTGILFHWILEFVDVMSNPEKREKLKAEVRALDKELTAAGCSQRTAKNWAAVGVFGLILANKYMPDFNYKEYLIQASLVEANYQKSDTTLMQFWELVESTRAQELSKITDKHIMREDNMVHIWYPAVFRIISDESRGRFPFSKNAVLSALREEPYFMCEDKKVSMGLDGTRRMVVTLDLTKCPDSLRNIALAN